LGYIIAGLLGAENYITTLIFVGILGGAGIGFGYVVPIAVGMRWYPDKKGLITGLAVAGFGFGATLWMTLAGKLGALGGGELIEKIGLSSTFIVLGNYFPCNYFNRKYLDGISCSRMETRRMETCCIKNSNQTCRLS
jgi:MFS transporter, OFA family, oxalate/formate antiporter